MDTPSLSSLLKSFLLANPHFDPFKDGFNRFEFVHSFRMFVGDNWKDDFKFQDFQELIVILDLNEMYEAIMTDIEDLIESINVDGIELIMRMLAISNIEALSIQSGVYETEQEENKNHPHEIHDIADKGLTNVFGDQVNFQLAADTNIEVCNELVKIISSCDLKYDRKSPKAGEEEANITLRRCLILANLLFIGLGIISTNGFQY